MAPPREEHRHGKIIGFKRGRGVDSTSLQVVIDNGPSQRGSRRAEKSLARYLLRGSTTFREARR